MYFDNLNSLSAVIAATHGQEEHIYAQALRKCERNRNRAAFAGQVGLTPVHRLFAPLVVSTPHEVDKKNRARLSRAACRFVVPVLVVGNPWLSTVQLLDLDLVLAIQLRELLLDVRDHELLN